MAVKATNVHLKSNSKPAFSTIESPSTKNQLNSSATLSKVNESSKK
jgi:hypothetical protein